MRDIQTPIEIEQGDNFKTVFSKFGCLAFDRQENLSELIGDLVGELDLDSGVLKFNDEIEFPVQLLGFYKEFGSNEDLSEDEPVGQWSWCWDNDDIGFDESLIELAMKIKEIGDEFSIKEFNTPVFQTTFNNCHIWAMAAAGVLDLDAYYAARVENIDVFVGIKSDLIKRNDSVEKFRNTYATFQKNFNVFPRLTFEGYTKLKGYIYKGRDEFSVAKIGDDRIIAGFTDRGNLTHIQMLTAD
ncbi:MAG: hypothetical protein Q4P18_04300 [Methanobrevibacter sp.]|uniref:DUF6882 domain-containing protein n=1 Tax=Methanobrevibacter sp. TaxID=66852 RepID=UPI0026DF9BF2|nr:DUF6882 domain-containing protein [Methanobrevibacter sp.]MDO5848733.1 hypothetical protein [Methanobrevibacter sp.]